MNSFSSFAVTSSSGGWILLIYWMLIVAMCSYGYFTLALMDNDRDQAHVSRLLDQLEQSDDNEAVDPERILVNMRLLLPHLAVIDPDRMETLQGRVDALETKLVEQSRDRGEADQVQAELRKLHEVMSLRADTDRRRSRELRDNLASLFVVFAAIVFVLAWMSKLRKVQAQNSSALGTLLFSNVAVSAVVTDVSDRIAAVNEAYLRMMGYAEEDVLGQEFPFNQSGQNDERYIETMRGKLHNEGRWSGELKLRNREGETFSDQVTRMQIPAQDGSIAGYLTLSTDVQSTDAAKKRMMWQAHHDPLTKLPNRNLFEERLIRVVLQAQSTELKSALISIDLDRFKIVNDSVGPTKADQLLMEASFRIVMCVRESDTVARLGGDHFAVILSEGDYAETERISRDLIEAIQKPFQLEDRELFITASVGVSLIPQDGVNTGELLQKADAARIQVKDGGGNGLAFFEPEINARAQHRLGLESALRKAISDKQLSLYYQPVIDLKRDEVTKAEALLRWHHPELGMVSPGEFIPIAEDTGMIVEIGQWVVEEVHRQRKSWNDAGLTELCVSLNVSPVQIDNETDSGAFLECLKSQDCNGIILELTESALIDNSEGVQKFLQHARALGCEIALDDFGTGFSSLGYLRNFEFDLLKIDKTFIDKLDNTRDHGLVASIISMGRILGMRVVAEGVEDASQVQRLRQIGCDYIQGYYYSKPLPAEDFYRFVTNGGLRAVG
ncbi:MAG: EAL domain-containing protein [Gammaproteobacteria bacterium]|nr:EAL domain-containing protein [Gammaproteobacteria bacterium]